MSGGSFDYTYQRLDGPRDMADTLALMRSRIRDWIPKFPTHSLELSRAEGRLRVLESLLRIAHNGLVDCRELMHDIEWICSGDSSVDTTFAPNPPEKNR